MILARLLGFTGNVMRPNSNATRYLNFGNNNVRAEPFIICINSTQNSVESKISPITGLDRP